MSRFRTNTQRQQVCHELQLPDVLRRRRESALRSANNSPRKGRPTGFTDLPAPKAPVPLRRVDRTPAPQPKGVSDPTRDAIEQLERRLIKLAGALQSQESLLLDMRQGGGQETGLASTFREVQGLEGRDPNLERKKELMEKIFHSNQELREKITSLNDLAE